MAENIYALDIEKIRRFLPHHQPFLMVDRVLEIHPVGDLKDLSFKNKEGTRVVAQKCVSYNEPHFHGHFPERSIMPGVMLIECMAQASSFVIYPYLLHGAPERLEKPIECILLGLNNIRFRKPVTPGDVLQLEVKLIKTRGALLFFEAEAKVNGQRVCEAEIMANWLSDISAKTS